MNRVERAQATASENRRLRNGKAREFAIRDLQKVVTEWFLFYEDRYGRRWQHLLDGRPWHASSTCWKDCTQMLDDRGITYVEGDLKEAIKAVIEQLRDETVPLEVLPVVDSVTVKVVLP